MDWPLGALDAVLLGLLLFSALIGVWRGLVFEVMSLAGWLVAYVAARTFSAEVAPHLPVGVPGDPVNQGAAFAATFVGVLLLWSVLTRVVRMLVRATPLSLVDRLLGGAFGVLRGGLVLLAIAAVVPMTPWARSPHWQQSLAAPWLAEVLAAVGPLFPPAMARYLSG